MPSIVPSAAAPAPHARPSSTLSGPWCDWRARDAPTLGEPFRSDRGRARWRAWLLWAAGHPIEGVRRGMANQVTAHFSVSASGSLIYLPGPVGTAGQTYGQVFVLAEVDCSGQVNPVRLSGAVPAPALLAK